MILRRLIALALLRHHVDEQRPLVVPRAAKNANEMFEVMSVEGPDVLKAQRFEKLAVHKQRLDQVAEFFKKLEKRQAHGGNALKAPAHAPLEGAIAPAGAQVRQVATHGAHVFGDGHLVVVEYDDHPRVAVAGVVERLIAHDAGQRAVSHHGHNAVVAVHDVAGAGHAQRGGDGCGSVSRRKGVVLALLYLGKPADAAPGPQALKLGVAAGKQLVRIALVPDVEYELVLRRVEHIVQRDGQFHHAQV